MILLVRYVYTKTNALVLASSYFGSKTMLRWLERVLVFFDALYVGVKIFRLELANHDQLLPQNNDNIKVSIFCRFLKKFVAMATQLGFEV